MSQDNTLQSKSGDVLGTASSLVIFDSLDIDPSSLSAKSMLSVTYNGIGLYLPVKSFNRLPTAYLPLGSTIEYGTGSRFCLSYTYFDLLNPAAHQAH